MEDREHSTEPDTEHALTPFDVLTLRLAEAQGAGALRPYLAFPDVPLEEWPHLSTTPERFDEK